MGVLSRLYLPCDSPKGEHGNVEMEVTRIPDRIAGIFDGDAVRRRILLILESGDAENAVAVGASRIAAESDGELFECSFLPLEIEAIDPPKRLVLAGRCGEDGRWRRDSIGYPERSDTGIPIRVDIYIEMADRCDAVFGTASATRAKRIGSDIDVRPRMLLVGKPTKISRRDRLFEPNDPLRGAVGALRA